MTQESKAERINTILTSCFGYLFIMDPRSLQCYWPQPILKKVEGVSQGEGIERFARGVFLEEDGSRFLEDCKKVIEGERLCLIQSYQCRPELQAVYGERICMRMWMMAADQTSSERYLIGMISEENKNCSFDIVTRIPNNDSFRKHLFRKVDQGGNWCILVLGIDDFANINELYSYSEGDLLLKDCASRIQKLMPEGSSLFRLDGDKFGLFFMDWGDEQGKAWYHKFKEDRMVEKFHAGGHSLFLSISGGLCCFPRDGEDFETIYHNAIKALQKAKGNGKNHLVVYSEELLDKDKRTAALLESLRESMIMGFQGFYMTFQPIVSAEDMTLVGGEALIRWRCPDFSENQEISPTEFVPILEENGMILETGNWALETAIRQCAQWSQYKPEFQMHINVSSQQFESPSFRYHLLDLLSRYQVKPSNIMLELTESGKVKEMSLLSEEFDFIRSQGIRISLDDFGTGYSSLEVLRMLSADEMKIDRSFLERISYDTTDQALLATLINLSHKMNMAVCVEGIENQYIQDMVCRMKPDLLQGYHYSAPLSAEEFTAKYFTEASREEASGEVLKKDGDFHQAFRQSLAYAELRPVQPINAQDLMDNVYAGIMQVGLDQGFTLISCNEGTRRILGYTSQEMDELFKNRVMGFIHPDDMEYLNREVRRQLGMGDTVTVEYRLVCKDGTPIWILARGTVYRNRDGSRNLIVVAINNDQKKREQLEKEKKLLMQEKLLSHIPTGLNCVRFDEALTIEYVSPSFLDLLGWKRDDIGQVFDGKFINLIQEEDRDMVCREMKEQRKVSDVLTIKYRAKCKDGHFVSLETISKVCDDEEDGIQKVYSVVVDGSDDGEGSAQKGKSLNLANYYESTSEYRGTYSMEYDFVTGMVTFSESFHRMSGYSREIAGYTLLKAVHQDDISVVSEAITEARAGIRPNPFEFRLFIPGGSYHWFFASVTPPDKLDRESVTALVKLLDIDEEKREEEQSLTKPHQDPTTALLDKAWTEEKIREILSKASPQDQYALLLMDIDHFKKINEIYGHIAGDEVLRLVAKRIRKQLGKEEIIGRIGGDEFLTLVPYRGDIQEVIEKAEGLKATICQPLLTKELPINVTVSMGISCCPEDGAEFYTLYRSADRALYRRKSMGRNGFCLASQYHLTEY